jgi:hypothetical protein
VAPVSSGHGRCGGGWVGGEEGEDYFPLKNI